MDAEDDLVHGAAGLVDQPAARFDLFDRVVDQSLDFLGAPAASMPLHTLLNVSARESASMAWLINVKPMESLLECPDGLDF